MKLNQRGALDMTLIVALIIVLAVGGFVIMRISSTDDEPETANTATTEVAELSDHIEVNEDEVVDVSEAEDEVTPIEEAVEENNDNAPIVSEEPVVAEAADDSANLEVCPAKGSENKITFYPSDYTEFTIEYSGDVQVVKGGSDNCGILRLAVDGHYANAAGVSIDTQSGALADTINFEQDGRYRVCSEVRVNTSHTGYFHEFPENAARPFFIPPNKAGGGEFHNHCTEHSYTGFESGYGEAPFAVVLSLHNNAFDEEGAPIEGEEAQSVDVRRVTVEHLFK